MAPLQLAAATAARRGLRALALFALMTAAFSLLHCQAPLAYSNQNQYFVHGLAQAGAGLLREDWLAGTRDPTPLFSGLVAFTVRYLHPWAFHVYEALVMGVYALSLLGLFVAVVGPGAAGRRWPLFVVLFALAHSGLARWCSCRWLGYDYPWLLQAGLAGQYLLGGMFQPSSFGVLLLAAVCLFVRDRPFLAAGCSALAAVAHSTYLLPAALLTLGFLAALAREQRWRQALGVAVLSLAVVLPSVVYLGAEFGPTSPEISARARDVLANVRIPHHTRPDLWFDGAAAFQIAWMLLGLALARPSRLFLVLTFPFVLGVLLTLLQVLTNSDTLALLFPWRISVVLVPIATTVILSRLAALPAAAFEGPWARAAAVAVVAALAAGGLWLTADRRCYPTDDGELPLLDFVRQTKKSGEVWFVPFAAPQGTTRGSPSLDFKPLAERRRAGGVIQVDLQRFRVCTGAPEYVDFKAIPYKDVEVLEWEMRLRLAERVQQEIRRGLIDDALAELRRQGVTHLVWPAGRKGGVTPPLPSAAGLVLIHEDARYRVYQLRAP
jgi:hypothetical protein